MGDGGKERAIPAGLKVGDTFELLGLTWKILEITEKGYACLANRVFLVKSSESLRKSEEVN